MSNQKIIKESQAEAKKKLQVKITSLQKELAKAEADIQHIDDYVVILPSMISKPFKKLGLGEQNTIYKTNKAIYDWFNKKVEEEYTSNTTSPNKEKTLQDYIDEGQPAGKLNFYEV